MGRQIPVILSRLDETGFLGSLRSSVQIRIMRPFAPTPDDLWLDDFVPEEGLFHIWNHNFGWEPQYGFVGERSHDPARIGWAYVQNLSDAPVLEYTRGSPERRIAGRLYWAKDFAAPDGLDYDVSAFSRWIDNVWAWVRKHGRKLSDIEHAPYVLPGAFAALSG